MILWTRPTQSGLGDRLIDCVMMLAYARSRGHELCLQWPHFKDKEIDCRHRLIDIQIENVQRYMTFPPDLHFEPKRHLETFDHYVGGDFNTDAFYEGHLKNRCEKPRFLDHIYNVSRRFGFCQEITAFLETIPRDFVAVHIRRGDKVRDEPTDGCFIQLHELDELDRLTRQALDHYRGQTFFFCGDEDEKVAPFIARVLANGGTIFGVPTMEKWRSTYFDLAVMSRALHIISSQRYSSFSRFAGIIGNNSVETVYEMSRRLKW